MYLSRYVVLHYNPGNKWRPRIVSLKISWKPKKFTVFLFMNIFNLYQAFDYAMITKRFNESYEWVKVHDLFRSQNKLKTILDNKLKT